MTIVEKAWWRMDGSIHISSRVDEGTCVIISLPFNIVKKVESKPQDRMPKLKDFAGCKILIAEGQQYQYGDYQRAADDERPEGGLPAQQRQGDRGAV